MDSKQHAQHQPAATNRKGIVKWFDDVRGFGFIVPEHPDGSEQPKDIFVHYSGINGKGRRTLHEGDHVAFNVIQGEKGPQAVDVQAFLSSEDQAS